MRTVKNKYLKYIGISVLMLLSMFATSCGDSSRRTIAEQREAKVIQQLQETDINGCTKENKASVLEVHFLDVGQGDATLFLCDGHAMLVDGGEDSKGTDIQRYLREHGVERLDYVVGTHPDADHIGGLDVILTKFDCDTVMFSEAESDTAAYRNVMDALSYKGYSITRPEVGDVFFLGSAEIMVVSCGAQVYEESNDASIGLKVTFEETDFLLIGDAEKATQQEMLENNLDLKADVLKAGHHGSSDSADEAFLEAVSPDFAVISCGRANDYGHPHEKTLRLFREGDVKVFRTDEQGTIVAVSDGNEISWSCEPSVSWKPGVYFKEKEELESPSSPEGILQELGEVKYVLNTNSMKFHKPSCESVLEMSKKNRQGTNLSREEILALGYSPCNNCNPE